MKTLRALVMAGVMLVMAATASAQSYHPTKENLDSRKEFARERFGIFLHWGIYASYGQGEWYLNTGKLRNSEYSKAASAFYPAKYNASEWVKAFKDAGAEYVTITSRHHDGFSMYDTEASDYNIVDATPWGKDVIKDLADACHSQGMHLHFYYSILDWIREDYPVGRTGQETGRRTDRQDYDSYFNFMKVQIKELMTRYAPVRALWFDGYWDKTEQIKNGSFDWRMPEFYEYIHSIDPACLVGNNHHIATLEGEDYQMFEKDLPGQNTTGFSAESKVSETLPLEMCETMNKHWGYSVSDLDYKSVKSLVNLLARATALNSNLLLNIGPQADGTLPEASLERLKGIGEWMRVNERSIKGCGPGPLAEQDWGVTTAPVDGGKTYYIHLFKNPGAILEVPIAKKARVRSVVALDGGAALTTRKIGEKLFITLPSDISDIDYVLAVTMR